MTRLKIKASVNQVQLRVAGLNFKTSIFWLPPIIYAAYSIN